MEGFRVNDKKFDNVDDNIQINIVFGIKDIFEFNKTTQSWLDP